MKSLESKGMVTSKFNWQWFYYFLSDEGIEYLRGELHLPAQVFPATLTKQSRPQRAGVSDPAGRYGDEGERKGKGKGKGKGGWRHGEGEGGADKQWEGGYNAEG